MTTRRNFLWSLGAGLAFAQRRTSGPMAFTGKWNSLRRHQVPAWFHEAKLGIFVHWGLYPVPAWAPPTGELGRSIFQVVRE